MKADINIYICTNCLGGKSRLEHQWHHEDYLVSIQEMPCSGKVDGQYMMHALEDGAKGLSIITCPDNECDLAEGNSRAVVRVETIKRLLAEIGSNPNKIELVKASGKNLPVETLRGFAKQSVERLIGVDRAQKALDVQSVQTMKGAAIAPSSVEQIEQTGS